MIARFSAVGIRRNISCFDQTLRVWDLSNGAELHRFDAKTPWIIDVAFSPDGKFALSGGGDKIANVETAVMFQTKYGPIPSSMARLPATAGHHPQA